MAQVCQRHKYARPVMAVLEDTLRWSASDGLQSVKVLRCQQKLHEGVGRHFLPRTQCIETLNLDIAF
eukprot:3783386-Amphidinium_carterae.1